MRLVKTYGVPLARLSITFSTHARWQIRGGGGDLPPQAAEGADVTLVC